MELKQESMKKAIRDNLDRLTYLDLETVYGLLIGLHPEMEVRS